MKRLPTNRATTQGFTLIELMIVVAIIGVLASIAIPKFADMLRKSRESNTKGNLGNLRSALNIYSADNEGIFPSDRLESLVGPYIESIPTVRLGANHGESSILRAAGLDLGCAGAMMVDTGNWGYANQTEAERTAMCGSFDGLSWGKIWISCRHTDTKGETITGW